MKYLFYTPNIDEHQAQVSNEEAEHGLRVLRLKEGNEVHCTNGRGLLIAGKISQTGKKGFTVQVENSQILPQPQPPLHTAIAPTKNMVRIEWFTEKAVECGITSIIPILCTNSERKVLKTERLHKIAVSAMKQSGQTWLPEIHELTPFTEVIKKIPSSEQRFIAHCRSQELPLITSLVKPQPVWVFIGPEGDFTVNEINEALAAGCSEISLGKNRLRTETAGLVACILLQAQLRA
jgi:16S rRNA (uracil1498-N3)-methyltransferase